MIFVFLKMWIFFLRICFSIACSHRCGCCFWELLFLDNIKKNIAACVSNKWLSSTMPLIDDIFIRLRIFFFHSFIRKPLAFIHDNFCTQDYLSLSLCFFSVHRLNPIKSSSSSKLKVFLFFCFWCDPLQQQRSMTNFEIVKIFFSCTEKKRSNLKKKFQKPIIIAHYQW